MLTALLALAAPLDPLRTFEVKLPILTDSKNATVYVFDKDTAGLPTCYDQCAVAWPPVVADTDTLPAPLSVVRRKDGTRQVAYQGRPLYTFFRDSRPGDINGDGLHGVWHLVRP